jgi:hypothetical protein
MFYSKIITFFCQISIFPLVSTLILPYHAKALESYNLGSGNMTHPIENEDREINELNQDINRIPVLESEQTMSCSEEAINNHTIVQNVDKLLNDKSISRMRLKRFKRILNRRENRNKRQQLRIANSITKNNNDSIRQIRRKERNLSSLIQSLEAKTSTTVDAKEFQKNFSPDTIMSNSNAIKDIYEDIAKNSRSTRSFLLELKARTVDKLTQDCLESLASFASKRPTLENIVTKANRSLASAGGIATIVLLTAALTVGIIFAPSHVFLILVIFFVVIIPLMNLSRFIRNVQDFFSK